MQNFNNNIWHLHSLSVDEIQSCELTRAQVVGNGFCSSVVEHWSSNPEDAVGSIPSRKALELHFFATGPGLGLIMHILTTLEFPKHNFEFHLQNFKLVCE